MYCGLYKNYGIGKFHVKEETNREISCLRIARAEKPVIM